MEEKDGDPEGDGAKGNERMPQAMTRPRDDRSGKAILRGFIPKPPDAAGAGAVLRPEAGLPSAVHRRLAKVAAALALVAAVGLPCAAAVVLPLGIRELAGGASRIVEGKVESLRVCGDVSDIHTLVELRVLRTFKGAPAERFAFRVPGGFLAERGIGMGVPGTPKFAIGERAIVFLEETRRGLEVYGLAQGAYHVKGGASGTAAPGRSGGDVGGRNGAAGGAGNPGAGGGSGGAEGPDRGDGACADVVEQDPAGPGTILSSARREDPEFKILGKSVPYGTFVELLDACVAGRDLPADIAAMADSLPPAAHGGTSTAAAGPFGVAGKSRASLLPTALVVLAALGGALAVAALSRCRRAARGTADGRRAAGILPVLAAASGAAILAFRGDAALAYAIEGPKWDLASLSGGRVPWEQSLTGTSDTLYEFDEVQDAFDEWEAIPESAIAFAKKGTTSINYKAYDGHNVVAWDPDPSFGSSVLAMTYWWYSGGKMLEADIIFNDRDFNWQARGQGGTQKVKGVALHEIGHVIGLDHVNPPPTAIMNPIDSGLQTLQDDDQAGAAYLYPAASYPTDPEVSAEASPDSGPPPLTVYFYGEGKDNFEPGSPVSYLWDFGDGTPASTEQNPLHVYADPGLYSVKLTVFTNRTNPADNRWSSATLIIAVGEELRPVPGKGRFKLNFRYAGRDSFKMQAAIGGLAMPFSEDKADDGLTFDCAVEIGSGASFDCVLNGKGKTIYGENVKLKVNLKKGIASIMVSKADLSDAMGVSRTEDIKYGPLDVPVLVRIGDIYISGIVSAQYSSKAMKGGKGRF